MSRTTTHAPWVNLVAVMMATTSPVVAAPTALSHQRHCHPGSRRTSHRRTMLACDRVKERKTPTA